MAEYGTLPCPVMPIGSYVTCMELQRPVMPRSNYVSPETRRLQHPKLLAEQLRLITYSSPTRMRSMDDTFLLSIGEIAWALPARDPAFHICIQIGTESGMWGLMRVTMVPYRAQFRPGRRSLGPMLRASAAREGRQGQSQWEALQRYYIYIYVCMYVYIYIYR